jgi:hypothetical protein
MRRAVLILLLTMGCNSGGGPSPPPAPDNVPRQEILQWVQPPTFEDNTVMDVYRDVARWDIYCTFFPEATDNDIVASVVNPDNLAFDLSLLRQYGIEPGPDGTLVFLKCVGIDNQQSEYSAPAEWRN